MGYGLSIARAVHCDREPHFFPSGLTQLSCNKYFIIPPFLSLILRDEQMMCTGLDGFFQTGSRQPIWPCTSQLADAFSLNCVSSAIQWYNKCMYVISSISLPENTVP